jgi:pimeloyl-ACP methyl ester carboxylesterase
MHISSPNTPKGAPAVFMQHGLMGSSEAFMMNGNNSPAFVIANAGFDVWLGNNRGSRYARKHQTINPDTDPADFFNFSFFELGQYDATA